MHSAFLNKKYEISNCSTNIFKYKSTNPCVLFTKYDCHLHNFLEVANDLLDNTMKNARVTLANHGSTPQRKQR